MANITRIDLRVRTGDRTGAGSDAKFYFGFGGREFRLDIPGTNDFERGMDQIFTLGTSSNIGNPSVNSPSAQFQLKTENIGKFPKYIRIEPETADDNWNLESVTVTVNPGPSQIVISGLIGDDHMWLGERNSKIFYFDA